MRLGAWPTPPNVEPFVEDVARIILALQLRETIVVLPKDVPHALVAEPVVRVL